MTFLSLLTTASLFLTGLAVPLESRDNGTSGAPAGAPILDLGYAKYFGKYNASSDVNTFNGIYFAQAPVGQLRWQPPLNIEDKNNYSTSGIINATAYGPTCIQGTPFWNSKGLPIPFPPTGAEDCLLLNIQVPAHPASDSLPIYLYIHGGGYTQGSSQTTGETLITQTKGGLIFVSIQYRLGVYGFMSNDEVVQNGVGNAGLLDQRSAIEWVKRNAASFGGDCNKITISGGSAGGGSVMSQLILWGGVDDPPFRAAISEYPWWQPFKDHDVREAQWQYFLNATGCGDISCLRSLDGVKFANASQQIYVSAYKHDGGYGYGDYWFGPAVDGTVIQNLPSHEFKHGHFAKVPVLVDHDEFEAVPFSNTTLNGTANELVDLQWIFRNATPSFWRRTFELYPTSAYNSTFYHRVAIFGDIFVDCPTYWLAAAMTDYGLPVYKMLFYAGSELHGATSAYILGYNNDGTYSGNDTIGAYMKDWYSSFTINLDPNAVSYSGLSKPHWPLWNDVSTNDGANAMNVNFTQIGVVRDFDVSDRCDFFHSQSQITWN